MKKLNTKAARDYLEAEHRVSFRTGTVIKWLRLGHLEGKKEGTRWVTTVEAIERAIDDGCILRPCGRKRQFTKEQRKNMADMYAKGRGKHTLKEIAGLYDCSESYVSRVVRGLR